MRLRDFWSKTSGWLETHRPSKRVEFQPEIDNEGLISEDAKSKEKDVEERSGESDRVLVKAVQPKDKMQSLERLQGSFDKLVEQLEGINNHLNRQAAHNEDLMKRIEQLPNLLQSFPAVVENQKQLTEKLFEQLKANSTMGQEFADVVGKIPTETAKQTDALGEINHQLAAAADADAQMSESFNKFNVTLEKLNEKTTGQTDSIMQMSRTFAASDRYLKYIVSRQRKSFVWVFMIAMGVCVTVILILTGIILYLKQ